MLAATYEGRTWYRPQLVRPQSCWPQFAKVTVRAGHNLRGSQCLRAVIYQDMRAVRCLPHGAVAPSSNHFAFFALN